MTTENLHHCGYVEAQDGPPCNKLSSQLLCAIHRAPEFSLCDSCHGLHGLAYGLCEHDQKPLCPYCHHDEFGEHTRRPLEQTQMPPQEAPQKPVQDMEAMRTDLAETVLHSLRKSARLGRSEMASAEHVVLDLGTSILLTAVAGLAPDGQEGNP